MKTKNDIIENLLLILVVIVAGLLTLVSYLVLHDLDHSTIWGRLIAVPMESLLFVFQPLLEKKDLLPALCAGSGFFYFCAGLVVLLLIRAAIKRGKKGGGGSGPII